MKNYNEQNSTNEKYLESIKEKLCKTKTVVTHFGDDLDNKASVYALELFAKENGIIDKNESLNVERVPAGQIKVGMLNVDTGGHKGSRMDEGTIVVDGDPKNGVKSAAEELNNLGIYVPEQIVELADTMPANVSALDSRRGLALIRYLTGEQAFKLAEDEMLDKSLTDKELKKYGLIEGHKKQQEIIDTAIEKIEKYTSYLGNGDKIVYAKEPITAGSAIAYAKGIPYFVSVSKHKNKEGVEDGVTFMISCKPGRKLPDGVINFGKKLVEEYRIDENTSGVFVHPSGEMVVAGGPKNPFFKIEGKTIDEMIDEIDKSFSFKNSLKVDVNNINNNINVNDNKIIDKEYFIEEGEK